MTVTICSDILTDFLYSQYVKSPIRLSVSIVTHNSEAVIGKCLKSLLQHWPKSLAGEIHVVDHHSTDKTLELLSAVRSPISIQIHNPQSNPGFGAGHNRVFKTVHSDFHCVCNPDIEFTEDVFTQLLQKLSQDPKLGQVTCKVKFPDGRLQNLNKRNPTLLDLFLRRFLPSSLKALVRKRLNHYEMLDEGYDHEYSVPFISGAFFISPTALLQKLGGFDERYFLYFEDADLSRQILSLGYKTLYVPSVSVIHLWARGAHRNVFLMRVFIQSAFAYFKKWGWALA